MILFRKILNEVLDRTFHINKAKEVANIKHYGQFRKFDGAPYIKHTTRVAKRVRYYTNDPDLEQAADLHDTLEDTKTSYDELKALFGKRVANLVKELTSIDADKERMGKTQYLILKMNGMSSDALTIKLLDRLDNISDFPTAPTKFVNKYKRETETILANLKTTKPIHTRIVREIHKKMRGF